ncbi:MAG: hypothetical protein CVV02_05360 [Firmicutes bacterium HGW-Firmicutes-7]|nr:MAG: hypothetical protein CVV02_05360 [Firmicutes bacterium HGW-Firmicutes-7]
MIKFSFNTKLLVGLTLIIFVIFLTLFLIFYKYYSDTSLENEYSKLSHSTESVSSHIDELFNQMSMAGLYISKNDFVNELLVNILKEDISSYDMIKNSGQIRDQLKILTYSFPNATNVVLFNANRNFYFHSGLTDHDEEVSRRMNDLDWYNSLIPEKNNLRILPPHQDFWVQIKRPVISIIRIIESSSDFDFGLLEFDIPYWNLENICTSNASTDTQVLIYNEDQDLIYPYKETRDYQKVVQKIDPEKLYQNFSSETGSILVNNSRYIYSKHHSDLTNWTTVLINYPSALIQSQRFFRIFFFTFSILILILVICAFSLLINRLTRPLNNLMAHIKEVRLDQMHLNLPYDGNDDIQLLNDSFNIMFNNIKDSINELYEGKLREVNAHLLALQAQINPHFIFNTLNVISASAEKNDNPETAIICNQLSHMLRYVSNSNLTFVSISDEIEHVINYLDLMKTHYTDFNQPDLVHLTYHIQIPTELSSIKVPKMILQPLIENSINHGFKDTMPPWHVSITGCYISENNWAITIMDNGSGFNNEIIEVLHYKINNYQENLKKGHFRQNTEIGGMGIMTTYMRLKIHYKSAFSFEFKNNDSKGAYIKLQIKDLEDDQEYD